MKFDTGIHTANRMDANDFGDPLSSLSSTIWSHIVTYFFITGHLLNKGISPGLKNEADAQVP